jgi:cell wall-associated NlpC family hydrolase
MTTRAAVVAEALSWQGTPYHDGGTVKGPKGGVDCAMLIVRCFVDAGAVEPFDPRPYPAQWHMHQCRERFVEMLFGKGAWRVETPKPGDMVLIKYGHCFSHGGIMVSDTEFVHASAYEAFVLRTGLGDGAHAQRPKRFYTVWKE